MCGGFLFLSFCLFALMFSCTAPIRPLSSYFSLTLRLSSILLQTVKRATQESVLVRLLGPRQLRLWINKHCWRGRSKVLTVWLLVCFVSCNKTQILEGKHWFLISTQHIFKVLNQWKKTEFSTILELDIYSFLLQVKWTLQLLLFWCRISNSVPTSTTPTQLQAFKIKSSSLQKFCSNLHCRKIFLFFKRSQ